MWFRLNDWRWPGSGRALFPAGHRVVLNIAMADPVVHWYRFCVPTVVNGVFAGLICDHCVTAHVLVHISFVRYLDLYDPHCAEMYPAAENEGLRVRVDDIELPSRGYITSP